MSRDRRRQRRFQHCIGPLLAIKVMLFSAVVTIGVTPGTDSWAGPRQFTHEVNQVGSYAQVVFTAPPPDGMVGPTTGVTLYYRVNASPITAVDLQQNGIQWTAWVPNVQSGDQLGYFFSQVLEGRASGENHGTPGIPIVVDTSWFYRVIGQPAPSVNYPIVTDTAGRLRRRHEGEYGTDSYVPLYFEGTLYRLRVIDYRNSVEIRVRPRNQGIPVGLVDLRAIDFGGYDAICRRPAFSDNGAMQLRSDGFYARTIFNTVAGQQLDFELTIQINGPGHSQYYSETLRYRVGEGIMGTARQHPFANAAGAASISVIVEPAFDFSQHVMNMSETDLIGFIEGKQVFDTDFAQGSLLLPPNRDCNGSTVFAPAQQSPKFTGATAGPLLNSRSCFGCHQLDGRGRPPASPGQMMETMVVKLSLDGLDAQGRPLPHPVYGNQLHDKAIGAIPEGMASVHYQTIHGQYADGTPYTLTRPIYTFHNLISEPIDGNHIRFSPRVAPQLPGLGLLEAVSDATIQGLADPNDLDNDGISGRVNMVIDEVSGGQRIGRFGWKAGQPSLRQQAASAAFNDMGVTNSIFGVGAELSNAFLDQLTFYLQGLVPPPRRNWQDPAAIAGMELFLQAGCDGCHTPVLQTGNSHPLAALRNVTIQPFTDLLLHDMGAELADGFSEFGAGGSEWRTPPLWGIGHIQDVNGHTRYLHDGRARNLEEAILWHGGEAAAARNAFLGMNAAQRAQLLAYLEYPFIDPVSYAGRGSGSSLGLAP